MNDPNNPLVYSQIAIEVINVSLVGPPLCKSLHKSKLGQMLIACLETVSPWCEYTVLPRRPFLSTPVGRTGFHRLLEDVGTVGKGPPRHHGTRALHHRRPWYAPQFLRCPMLAYSPANISASGIGLIHAFAVSAPGQEVYNEDITRWFSAFGALTLLANLYAVVAISYRAWYVPQSLALLAWSLTCCDLFFHYLGRA